MIQRKGKLLRLATRLGVGGMVLLGLATSSGTLSAQTDSTRPIGLLETAATLLRRGLDAGQPRLVLAAAQLLLTAGLGGHEGEGPPGGPVIFADSGSEDQGFTAAGLLRLASRMAVENNDAPAAAAAAALARSPELGLSGDRELQEELSNRAQSLAGVRGAAGGLLRARSPAAARGAAGGPLWREGFLAKGAQAEFAFAFEGGRVLNRIVLGASHPKADLECSLVQDKKVVAKDDGPGSGCDIKWDQKPSGTLTLRVRNGGAGTYFVLTSN